MKYCRECGVNVNKKHLNCPLCGAHLEEEGKGAERYRDEIEDGVNNFELEYREILHRNFLHKKSFILTLIIIGICVLVNLLTNRNSLWSCYVAMSSLIIYFSVISSIFKRRRFYSIISNCTLILTASIVLFDVIYSYDVSGSIALFGNSLRYVAPAFLIAVLITNDAVALNRNTKCTYYLLSLLLGTVVAMLPQIALWIFMPETAGTWLAFATFVFAVLNAGVIYTLNWRNVVDELRKKFNIG